jgi:hypothetical protein
LALGYLTGKGSSRLLNVRTNLPLLLAASVLPDIDLILPFLNHRGPTHSLIIITALMIPFLIAYKRNTVPYFVALFSHVLIGDFLTGGAELFWPLSYHWVGLLSSSVTEMSIELLLFAASLAIMLGTKDLQRLLKPNNHNLALLIPFGAVLGSMLLLGVGFGYVLSHLFAIHSMLFIASLFCLLLFAYSIFVGIFARTQTYSLT